MDVLRQCIPVDKNKEDIPAFMDPSTTGPRQKGDFQFKKEQGKDESYQLLACDDDLCTTRTAMYLMLTDNDNNSQDVDAGENGGIVVAINRVGLVVAFYIAIFV